MNQEKFTEIQAAIFEVGLLFGKQQQPSEPMVNAYAKALMNYSPKQIVFAFNQVILSGSAFFPSLAELLKHLRPAIEDTEDRASEIANEIVYIAQAYGYMQTELAFSKLSLEAQEAVGHPSFLLEVCNSPIDNLTTTKAQLRRSAKASLERKKISKHNNSLDALGLSDSKAIEGGAKLLDFSNYITEGKC